jgi:hypothetical protein
MSTMDKYSKYIVIGEHVIVAGVALAALNVVVIDGFSGVSITISSRFLYLGAYCVAFF